MAETFGRVQSSTVARYKRAISRARNETLSALPSCADEQIRVFTLNQILSTAFRDWNENENYEELSDGDWADFHSFVSMAADIAGKTLSAQTRPIYESTLQSLMDDWLYNWNGSDNSGPPSLRKRQLRSTR